MNSHKLKKSRLSGSARNYLIGLFFVSLFIIGFVVIYIPAIIDSIRFSFSEMDADFNTVNVKWANYHRVLFVDPTFVRDTLETLGGLVINAVVIIFYSVVVSTLLNMNLPGKGLFRALLFLPVIISTGVIDRLMGFSAITGGGITGASDNGTMSGVFDSRSMMQYILSMNINAELSGIIVGAIENIYDIITRSGVQIVIFLAGLQSVPNGVYEAAKVEGCTAWETFWKITMPLISPLIAVNVVYTVIDSFTSPKNVVMNKILSSILEKFDYGTASAMMWCYFLLVGVVLGITLVIVNKLAFYESR